jgi:hypothetical protein
MKQIIHALGQSKDSLITLITDKIIHGGDLIMMTRDKKASPLLLQMAVIFKNISGAWKG